jgi:hypothetical protein
MTAPMARTPAAVPFFNISPPEFSRPHAILGLGLVRPISGRVPKCKAIISDAKKSCLVKFL